MTPTIHINHGAEQVYIGQTRGYMNRKFVTVTRKCKTIDSAIRALSKHNIAHEARILSVAKDIMDDYYGPAVVMELKRVQRGLL
jgi:hypothetical protein